MPSKQVTIQGVMTWDEGPLGIWGGGNVPMPSPPIYLPPNPPGIWGPPGPWPTPPIVIPPDAIAPGVPTHPIYLPVYPAHPIVIPPDAIAPGVPAHPIVLPPPYPAHPIVIPPGAIDPGPPPVPAHPIVLPPGIWGGGNVPMPNPPIYIPPQPSLPPGGTPMPPAASVPIPGSLVFVENVGWIFVPEGASGSGQPPSTVPQP